ncbi:ABC transporter permease subunit [Blastococcus brunescens]|uniref:ABC transporter permease subunit n=1 Tax=Blastococcus brunescens TaxID=1564165 RepID=A0ABZ1BAG1_9ACTN|nr:ABC transporter permease subunit [Blastococcus sp. BMG 8361]WRL66811.1 ABC transporter permease subunit [Blastococcus sp. BMG 8361]
MGMTGRQVMLRAELPLATPLLMAGVRTAAVQVVATATLAALVAGGGLGRIITLGFAQQEYGVVLAGAVLVAVLAIGTEVVLAAVSWAVTPGQKRLPFLRSGGDDRPPGDTVAAPIAEGDAGPVAVGAPSGSASRP